MPQQSVSQSQQPLTSNLVSVILPRFYIALGIMLSATFAMPTAQAASCKIPKSYYKNVSCTASRGYLLAIKDFGAPVALLDSRGKRVVDLSRYQKVDADKIVGGLFPVQRNGRVGYVNMQGREVVPAIYDRLDSGQGWARPVSEGRIVVKKNGRYGVINTSNQTIVPFSAAISDIDNYRNGVARVRKNKATSWLDTNGNTTSNPNDIGDNNDTGNNSDYPSASNNDPISSSQKRTSKLTAFTTLQPNQQDGRWGFVDDQNVTMITYSFDEVRPFSEGLAGVRIDNNWGFISLGGELVIPFRFDNDGVTTSDSYKDAPAFIFKEGRAWVGSLKNGDKICINKEGVNVSCD